MTITSDKWGYLRETSEEAKNLKLSSKTKMHKTGLDEYLKAIFPEVNDWVHDKVIPSAARRLRPDYRSEELKLIVEFNGLQHYTSPNNILRDKTKEEFFTGLGYKVVVIPYFIQLTNKAAKILFDVSVSEPLFDENIPSLLSEDKCTPAFLCPLGIKRMAEDFIKFPEQYEININSMKEEDLILTSWDLLEREYNNLKSGKAGV